MFQIMLRPMARLLRRLTRGAVVRCPGVQAVPAQASGELTAPLARPLSAAERRLPYGERPARNRQLTLLAELLGDGWRSETRDHLGVDSESLTRRQAAAEIMRVTGGTRPGQVARSTWHRVAVDPDWVDRPRRSRRAEAWSAPRYSALAHRPEQRSEPALPVQLRAIRLLAERLGIDAAGESRSKFGVQPAALSKRVAAGWIAELTQQVLLRPEQAPAA